MTINVPEKYIAIIDILIDLGVVNSRSECMRTMLSEWLNDKLKMIDNIDKLVESAQKPLLEYDKEAIEQELTKQIKVYSVIHEEVLEDGTRFREYEKEIIEVHINPPTEAKFMNED